MRRQLSQLPHTFSLAPPLCEYSCSCGYAWSVAPSAGPQYDCPHCGSLYFSWVNFESVLAIRDAAAPQTRVNEASTVSPETLGEP